MPSFRCTLQAASLLLAATCINPMWGQSATPARTETGKSAAYYHAALAHLYSELAAQPGGRSEFIGKAIDNYKLAMKADPESGYLANSLADLYLQTGQIRTAVSEFEEVVRRNPNDTNGRRILARFYTARIREGNQNRINQEMTKAALEQYRKVSELAPGDVDNWLMLGRMEKLAQNSSAAEKAFKQALALDKDNEDAMTGLAMVYSDLGDTAAASQMLKRVAERNPNLRTLTSLAGNYEQMKEYKLAAETYGRALEMNKENADLKRAYAQALFVAEDMDKAQAVFEELAAEDPNDLLAALRLSQIYRQKRDFTKAQEFAKKARQLDPNNLEIRYNEVSLLEAEGKTPEAITLLKEVLETIPKRPTSVSEKSNRIILLERLGMLYRMTEQTPLAVAAYREITELDPDISGRATAQVIDAYRAGKDYAAAEAELKSALAKYPDDRVVKVIGANLHADLGRFKEAEATLRSLLNGKDDRETYMALAQVYDKSKNYAEMAKVLDATEKLSRNDDEKEAVFFMRGAMLERQKKYDAAEVEFKKVLAINPESASALNYLGYMLADRNMRLNEALEMIKKAVDMDPYNSAYLDSLGWVYFRMNRLDEAEDYLKKSIARGSRDATVHDHLGDVYAGQENLKAAIAQWELAIREWHTNAPSDLDPAEVAKLQKKVEGAKVRLARENGTARPKQ